ncbi:MAG: PilZ domain-containing protein [Phycisphaerae bacterium]
MPSLPRAVEIRPVAFEHQDLIELLDRLDARSAEQDADEGDLRSHERVTCRSFAIMTLCGAAKDDPLVMIPLRNISRGGVAFLYDHEIVAGTPCSLRIVLSEGDTIDVDGQVARCTWVAKRTYEIGLQLHDPLDLVVGEVPH